MPKKPDAYYRPQNLTEALRLLAQPDMVPLGGGTKLLATEAGVDRAGVVDLQALGLDQVEAKGDHLHVGAMTTLAGLADHLRKGEGTATSTPFLLQAIHLAGPNTYRNSATIGGTIAGRLADSELLAALLALGTELTILSPQAHNMSLTDYLKSEDAPKGLISEISIPWTEGTGAAERVARTPADYPIVSISAWQPAGGSTRLAATGLGPRPVRLFAAEVLLRNTIDEQTIAAAASAAGDANSHPGDFRGSAPYRVEMATVLTKRVLRQL